MKPEILEALEGSICKWDGICTGILMDSGSANCPLCALFDDAHQTWTGIKYCWSDKFRSFCPVMDRKESVGIQGCTGTPYSILIEWEFAGKLIRNEMNSETKDVYIEYAEKELVFLLNFLPEGHRWREQI